MNRSRGLCAMLAWAGFIGLTIPARADASNNTPFLDRPLPPNLKLMIHSALPPDGKGPDMNPMVSIPSLYGAMTILEAISGKKAVLSKDLGSWPDEETEQNWGMGFGLVRGEKVRDFFEQVCFAAGLTWNYDAGSDTIQLDPQWKRDDPRSMQELINLVAQTKPEPWVRLPASPTPNRIGGHGKSLDEWRIAFDALLSKPTNFSSAGTLRVYHDSHGHVDLCPFPVQNDFAGPIQNDRGGREVLILNEQTSESNKDSAGDLAYYLFDEDGKFLKGGVYAVADGAQSGIVKVALENGRTVTVDVGYGSFKIQPDHLHLGVVHGDFVLLGSTDHQGKERDAEETRKSLCPFSHMMQLTFGIAGK